MLQRVDSSGSDRNMVRLGGARRAAKSPGGAAGRLRRARSPHPGCRRPASHLLEHPLDHRRRYREIRSCRCRKASTATSLAAFRMVGAPPPACNASRASRSAGKRIEVGLREFQPRRPPPDRAAATPSPSGPATPAYARSGPACRGEPSCASTIRHGNRPCHG